jgi:hypothetical protein
LAPLQRLPGFARKIGGKTSAQRHHCAVCAGKEHQHADQDQVDRGRGTQVHFIAGSTDIKDGSFSDLADKRSRLLERFLRRLAAHPRLVVDNDVRDFLSFEGDLPKANFTSTFSGSSVKKVGIVKSWNQ